MKKKRIYLFIALFFLIMSSISAQSSFRLKVGYGTYQMKSLSTFMLNTAGKYRVQGIDAEIINEFPPYLNFQLQYFPKVFPKRKIGVFISYKSTGARIAYSDYSGKIQTDVIASGYAVGPFMEWNNYTSPSFDVWTVFQFSALYSTVTIEENVEVFTQKVSDKIRVVSWGIGIEPGVQMDLKMFENIYTGIYLGIEFTISQKLHLSDNPDAYLSANGFIAKADWLGFRGGIVIGI